MTAHELARILLDGPDDLVMVPHYGEFYYGNASIFATSRVVPLNRLGMYSTLHLKKPCAGELPAVILHVDPSLVGTDLTMAQLNNFRKLHPLVPIDG